MGSEWEWQGHGQGPRTGVDGRPVRLGLEEGVKVPLSVLVGVGEGLGEGVPGVGSTIRNMRTPQPPLPSRGQAVALCTV
jgi:hypothetical protein